MKIYTSAVLLLFLFMGCATSPHKKVVIWETSDVSVPYRVIGPVSVTEQIVEKPEDAVQGLAGFISQDGRVSDQIPSEMKIALDAKREAYKDRIFDKLGEKAKGYDADAVMATEYHYIPPYASFSTKATVTAKGTMIKYK